MMEVVELGILSAKRAKCGFILFTGSTIGSSEVNISITNQIFMKTAKMLKYEGKVLIKINKAIFSDMNGYLSVLGLLEEANK